MKHGARGVYCRLFLRGEVIKTTNQIGDVTCLDCLRWFGRHKHGNSK